MSGHANYSIFKDSIPKNTKIVNVKLIKATEESINEYGRFVENFDNEEVINCIWPKNDGRKIDINTGNQALPTQGIFYFYNEDNYKKSINSSVPNGDYITGVLPKNEIKSRDLYFYTREANYHPCGGQVVFPENKGSKFILLLSKAGDNITPNDFVSFLFDGTKGFQIYPNIWHQPLYQLDEKATFLNKQCSVHACVSVDTFSEFNTLLKVNLKL